VAFRLANALCDDEDMTADHTPDDETLRIYARHKRHHDAAAELKPEIRERAAKDLLAGSTAAELAKLTGLSDEFFRRIARAVGAERKREPTVGREVEAKRQATAQPARRAAPRPAQHRPAAEPEQDFSPEKLRTFCDLARKRATPEQMQRLERTGSTVKAVDRDRAIADEAYTMGLLKDADLYPPKES
jgi:hypothetical protein